ncbi:hypothetical protein ACFOU2_16245 [Bacillus songklensis]|uniref:Uncharacterized protein n=1 Tax=Bacillus songklensis TaxID=1069116 RepID=A0ABV8B450_9BACI
MPDNDFNAPRDTEQDITNYPDYPNLGNARRINEYYPGLDNLQPIRELNMPDITSERK